MMDEMDLVFKKAKEKAINRISKKGNTATPWNDFGIEHLKDRLFDEFREWLKFCDLKDTEEELLDIINLAAFVYLAEQRVNLMRRAKQDAANFKRLSRRVLARVRGEE